ncbi:hypothetical protein E2C01_053605 [Portunus trituberculatus]|uniref:Uncharacterized protein n=1 Tax=Portunus trituberculatus TaxID=210409 RepID=A0A5B7GHK9_PORTR|nr:hypothetical protein [Portunus trituberculatus]
MMDFICEKFPEARGPVVQVPATIPHLRYAHPIAFMISQAFEVLTCANESSKPLFANYPARRYYRSYRTSGDEGRSLLATVRH